MSKKCSAYVVSANLSDKEALKIESLLINTLMMFPSSSLTNLIKGHHAFSIKNISDIEAQYSNPIGLGLLCQKIKDKSPCFKTKYSIIYVCH